MLVSGIQLQFLFPLIPNDDVITQATRDVRLNYWNVCPSAVLWLKVRGRSGRRTRCVIVYIEILFILQCHFLLAVITGKSNEMENYISIREFPTPSLTSTTIYYHITSPSLVKLHILNIEGDIVDGFTDYKNREGTYNFNLNNNDYPSGVYIVKLQANGRALYKNIFLMK